MKKRQLSAKERVIAICETLAPHYPKVPDPDLQDVAVDLHDIAHECPIIEGAIRELEQGQSLTNDEVRAKLLLLGMRLKGELQFHIDHLIGFLQRIGIPVEEDDEGGR